MSSSAGDSGKRIEDAVVTLRAEVGSEGPVINYEEGGRKHGNIGGPRLVALPPRDRVKHFENVDTFYAPPLKLQHGKNVTAKQNLALPQNFAG